jgi:hypothetical protein
MRFARWFSDARASRLECQVLTAHETGITISDNYDQKGSIWGG